MSSDNDSDHRQLHAAPDVAPVSSPFFLLDQGELCFLVAGEDILSLLAANQLTASADATSCGAIQFEQHSLPVFCLTKNLQLRAQLPATHTALVILQAQGCCFALACTDIIKLADAAPALYSVPVSMSSRKQPFTEFAVIGNRAAGVTNAEALVKLLQMRGAILAPGNLHETLRGTGGVAHG